MVWLLLLVFGFVVFGLVSKASQGNSGAEGDAQTDSRALANRSQATQPRQQRPSSSTWQERVAAIEAAREGPVQPVQSVQPAAANTQVKEGFSRYESPPQVLMDGLEIKTTGGAQVTLPLTLTASVIIEIDEVFAALNRQATQARKDGDMGLAVDLLRQAKQRQGDGYEDTRLALYLQHAGRFDEAMAEFDWLLAQVDAQVEASLQHRTPTTRKQAKALMRYKIHDKARLACKREGRSELEEHHQHLARAYDQERLSLQTAAKRAERAAQKRKEAWFEKQREQARALFRETSGRNQALRDG